MLQTRSAKRTAAAAVKIAADMVDEGLITKEEALGADRAGARRPAPARPVRPGAPARPRRGSPRASTPRPARPSGGPSSTPTTRSSGSSAARRSSWSAIETSPDDFHGMAVAAGHPDGPRRRHLATPRSSPARSASRAWPAARELIVDYAASTARCNVTGIELRARATGSASTARPARSSSARCRPSTARFEDQPELQTDPGLGRRGPPHGGLDQRRQARGGRPGPPLRRPGHRPVPDRAHVPRGRAARDRARRDPRRQRGDPGQGQAWPPARR